MACLQLMIKKTLQTKNQLQERDSLNNSNSNCHTTSSTNDTFLIQPYTNPLYMNEAKNKKRIQQKQIFGDHLVEKEPNQVQIVSQNVNCIRVSQHNNHKTEYAKNWLIQHDVDIAGWQETGIVFHTLPRRNRLSERMKDIRWNKFQISYTFQYGGYCSHDV